MSDAPHKFDFHIGDYLRDTEDLSLTQHGAYLRLMLWYYATARSLPNDLDRIYRRCNATSREEKNAVEYVLGEFFQLENGKWVHKRIEEELAKWGIATKNARDSARQRWENFRKNINAIKESVDANAVDSQYVGNANPHASLLPPSSYLLPSTVLDPNPLVNLPLKDGSEFAITKKILSELDELYPDMDALGTLKEIKGWNIANPTKRKTKRGIMKHIHGWFIREQKHVS